MMPKVDKRTVTQQLKPKCKSFGSWHVLQGRMECDAARACVINGIRTETLPEHHAAQNHSPCIKKKKKIKSQINENQLLLLQSSRCLKHDSCGYISKSNEASSCGKLF